MKEVAGSLEGNDLVAAETAMRQRLQELSSKLELLEQQNQQLCLTRDDLEAELESYAELYDFAPVGYCTLARDGAIRKVNLTGASLLGEDRATLLGRSLDFFVSDASRPAFNTMLDKLFKVQQKQAWCEVVFHPQGLRSPLPVNIVAMTSATRDECLAVIIDISERKRQEAEAAAAKDEVEFQQVRQRAAELLTLNQQLTQEIERRNKLEETLFDSQTRLRNLSAKLQFVREEERKSIAREIHDELGQLLATIQLGVSQLAREFSNQHSLAAKTAELGILIADGIKTVQRIAAELRPAMLDVLGLPEALEWQSLEFRKQTGINCDIEVLLINNAVHPDVATAIFRIFQESLTNIRRHSQATRVEAYLFEQGQSYYLRVVDNGRGISLEEISSPRSIGLIGIRERVFILGGRVRIYGVQGKGTALFARVPIKPKGIWYVNV